MQKSLQDISLPYPFPNTLSGYLNLPGTFLHTLGTHRKSMDRNNDNLGDILPKRYTTLSDDTTANTQEKKHDHCCHGGSADNSIYHRFQGNLVSDKILTEICHSEMIVIGIPGRIQKDQRNQTQIEDHRSFPIEFYGIYKCADIRYPKEYRMMKPYGTYDCCRKVDQVYHRMVTVKSHLPHPSFRI